MFRTPAFWAPLGRIRRRMGLQGNSAKRLLCDLGHAQVATAEKTPQASAGSRAGRPRSVVRCAPLSSRPERWLIGTLVFRLASPGGRTRPLRAPSFGCKQLRPGPAPTRVLWFAGEEIARSVSALHADRANPRPNPCTDTRFATVSRHPHFRTMFHEGGGWILCRSPEGVSPSIRPKSARGWLNSPPPIWSTPPQLWRMWTIPGQMWPARGQWWTNPSQLWPTPGQLRQIMLKLG